MNPFQNILVCPECGKFAKKQRRWALKRWTRKSSNDWVYVCPGYPACDTYVGCHPRTDLPLGTMAGSDLRLARRKAHKAFDWAWKSRRMSRTEAYRKLADILGIPPELFEKDAHIARLDEEQCQVVIDAFNGLRPWKTPHR